MMERCNKKQTRILLYTAGILIILILAIVVISCENPLMDILTAPEFCVIYEGSEITDTEEIRLPAQELETPGEYFFTLKNKGRTSELKLTGAQPVALSGTDASMYSLSPIDTAVILPEGSVDFTLTFTPADSTGDKSAQVVIENDDDDESFFTFTVTGSGILSITSLSPSIIITCTEGAETNVTPIPFTVEFSKSVTGFNGQDIDITGGSLVSLDVISSTEYTIYVTPESENCTITVKIPTARVWSEVAQGWNLESNLCSAIYDFTLPAGAMTIDSGLGYTNIKTVDLYLDPQEDDGTEVTEMWISNDSDFSSGAWEAFASTKSNWSIDDSAWTVDDKTEPGTRTIYYKFLDSAGNESTEYSESIVQTWYGYCDVSTVGNAYCQ